MPMGRFVALVTVLAAFAFSALPGTAHAGSCDEATAQLLPAGTTGSDGTPLAGDISEWYQVFADCEAGAGPHQVQVFDCSPTSCNRSIVEYWAHTPEPCSAQQTVNFNDTIVCESKPNGNVCMYLRTQPGPSTSTAGNTELMVPFADGTSFKATLPLNTMPGPACSLTSGATPGAYDLSVSFNNPPTRAEAGVEVIDHTITVTNLGERDSPATLLSVVAEQGGGVFTWDVDGKKAAAVPVQRDVPALSPSEIKTFEIRLWDEDSYAHGYTGVFYAGYRGPLVIKASTDATDEDPGNNVATANTTIGSTSVETQPECPGGRRAQSAARTCRLSPKQASKLGGTAKGKVKTVQLALLRRSAGVKPAAKECQWLKNAKAKFAAIKATKGKCVTALWLEADGKKRWSFELKKPLPKGDYVAYSRAISKAGGIEASARSKKDNRLKLKVG